MMQYSRREGAVDYSLRLVDAIAGLDLFRCGPPLTATSDVPSFDLVAVSFLLSVLTVHGVSESRRSVISGCGQRLSAFNTPLDIVL